MKNSQSAISAVGADDSGEELIADLVRAIDEGEFDIVAHAEQRAQKMGSSSFIKSVLRPLVDLFRRRPLSEEPRRQVIHGSSGLRK